MHAAATSDPYFVQGSSAELRELAAEGLGELVEVTGQDALKPYVVQITGPLIRIIGDRFPWQIKAAILRTLGLLIGCAACHFPRSAVASACRQQQGEQYQRLVSWAAILHAVRPHTLPCPAPPRLRAAARLAPGLSPSCRSCRPPSSSACRTHRRRQASGPEGVLSRAAGWSAEVPAFGCVCPCAAVPACTSVQRRQAPTLRAACPFPSPLQVRQRAATNLGELTRMSMSMRSDQLVSDLATGARTAEPAVQEAYLTALHGEGEGAARRGGVQR